MCHEQRCWKQCVLHITFVCDSLLLKARLSWKEGSMVFFLKLTVFVPLSCFMVSRCHSSRLPSSHLCIMLCLFAIPKACEGHFDKFFPWHDCSPHVQWSAQETVWPFTKMWIKVCNIVCRMTIGPRLWHACIPGHALTDFNSTTTKFTPRCALKNSPSVSITHMLHKCARMHACSRNAKASICSEIMVLEMSPTLALQIAFSYSAQGKLLRVCFRNWGNCMVKLLFLLYMGIPRNSLTDSAILIQDM